jgi:hypothetical protein
VDDQSIDSLTSDDWSPLHPDGQRWRPRTDGNAYFGWCPICGADRKYVNIGSEQWFFCRRHQVKWKAASGCIPGWEEDIAYWEANEQHLSGFLSIQPGDDHRMEIRTFPWRYWLWLKHTPYHLWWLIWRIWNLRHRCFIP